MPEERDRSELNLGEKWEVSRMSRRFYTAEMDDDTDKGSRL
jgi:hypothetical protein